MPDILATHIVPIIVLGIAVLLAISVAAGLLPIAILGATAFAWYSIYMGADSGLLWFTAIGGSIASLILLANWGPREDRHR